MERSELKGRLLEIMSPAPGQKDSQIQEQPARNYMFPAGTQFRYLGEDREFANERDQVHKGMVCLIGDSKEPGVIDVSGTDLKLVDESR